MVFKKQNRRKKKKKKAENGDFKLLVLSYMHATLYISFFCSNNIVKFYVV